MDIILGGGEPGGDAGAQMPADAIKESDTARFGVDVIQASMSAPVIVDFWAPWCGPCKQLGPHLEKAVRAARGAVRLVKIDIDKNQTLAGQLRIQSIPAVYAFFQGQPVDGFVGAQPESQVKAFVERLAKQNAGNAGPSPLDQALDQARAALEAKQFGAASALFGQILQNQPENDEALAGLIRCSLAAGDIAEARRLFDETPAKRRANPALSSAAAALELAEAAPLAGSIAELAARVSANPGDHQGRFDLAMAQHAAGDRETAAETLLEMIRRDRAWNDQGARKQLVKFFEAWGPTDPLTVETRRRLSSLLFS